MKKIILMLFAIFIVANCTDNDTALRVLESNGYSNVQFTGYKFFGCSKDDTYHTGFIAVSPNNKPVEGTVCGGLFFKNSTIRFE